MHPFHLLNLFPLLSQTEGNAQLKIGLIDGPVALDHPDLERSNIQLISGHRGGACSIRRSAACMHGTQVAGILSSKRGKPVAGICPNCTLLIEPIFQESIHPDTSSDSATLARAILKLIAAGANVINLSLGLDMAGGDGDVELAGALGHAAEKQVLIVTAAGNQGTINSTGLTRHGWAIPVVAVGRNGKPMDLSNLSATIGRNGVGAPGEAIPTLFSDGKYSVFQGTSAAAPFVTGTIALLWSLFPHKSAGQVKEAILRSSKKERRSIVPPLLDAGAAFEYLKNN